MFSDPVVGNKFFGRSKTLGLFSKRVSALKEGYRQNIAFVGPNLIGKSSLILQFFSTFNCPDIIPVYIDLKPNSLNNFIYKFLGSLLYHYLKNKNLKTCEDLDGLKKSVQPFIPQTLEVIGKVEDNIRNLRIEEAYSVLLGLTAVLKRESGISCIVIVDEFHLLDTYEIKKPYAGFAREIMMQKDTMYIFTSSQVSFAKKILAGELSLLFGNFEVVHLEPFDYRTCCNFLEKRFGNIALPQSYRDFLISFSERHPFYLDILSNKLMEKAKELNENEISPGLISQTFNSLIYDSKGIFNQYFTNLLEHSLNGVDYSLFLPILFFTSEKGCQLSDISRATQRQAKVLSKQIAYLLEKDLLNKTGVFYRIQDKMFRFWLKSVYQKKSLSLSADPFTESKDFSREIENRILRFSRETQRSLTERIIDLFTSFRNEIIRVQNKFFKFCYFEEVRHCPSGDIQGCVIARYKDGYWVCLVRESEVNEAQIQDFLRHCKKLKYKIRRKIIIAFKEMDLNVRLLALEKKIWIWSPADLNLILDLYDKEQIIY
jgi:hypothetical protein